jgi:D-arginine dehydrogenase
VFTFDPGVDHGGWPMVVDIGDAFYFKPEGPHVLASPADETPMEPHDVRHDELDVALGIDRINAVTTLEIRHVKSAWAGLRSFVADRRPVAGFDVEAPGFFWLAGQGGYGIKTAPALGRATASLVAGGELPDDLVELGLTAGNLSPARLAGHTADST